MTLPSSPTFMPSISLYPSPHASPLPLYVYSMPLLSLSKSTPCLLSPSLSLLHLLHLHHRLHIPLHILLLHFSLLPTLHSQLQRVHLILQHHLLIRLHLHIPILQYLLLHLHRHLVVLHFHHQLCLILCFFC
uniref:Uncharacterized protein n=1 Tax=Cacopsylla melanoneura TaxID=428564 RepID=A0A8D8X6E9_9HEMI